MLGLGLVLASGCAEDEALVVPGTCGNMVREPAEECDTDGPGCIGCKEAPGFRCRDNVCTEACGDGKVVGTEECDPPDGTACDSTCRISKKKDAACDAGGLWAIRQTDFALANLGTKSVQTSSNWYLVEIAQTGTTWRVTRSLFCGTHVTGSVTVHLTDEATRGLLYANTWSDQNPGGARTGEMYEDGESCRFTASRHYFIRGGSPALLPATFADEPELATLPTLPVSNDIYDVTKGGDLDLARDEDGDGFPGVPYAVTGLVTGTRSVVQRDWSEYESDQDHVAQKFSAEFFARSDFRVDDRILHLECAKPGEKCPLLEIGTIPATDRVGRVFFRWLGADTKGPRAKEILAGEPFVDPKIDFETCMRIQEKLPHDKSTK